MGVLGTPRESKSDYRNRESRDHQVSHNMIIILSVAGALGFLRIQCKVRVQHDHRDRRDPKESQRWVRGVPVGIPTLQLVAALFAGLASPSAHRNTVRIKYSIPLGRIPLGVNRQRKT